MFDKLQAAWRAQRESSALRRRAIADDLWKRTLLRYPFLQRREPGTGAALRRMTSLFLDRKEFSTTGGLRLTDAMAVSIAAQACLPVLRLGLHRYDGFIGIVVHPDQVVARRRVEDEDGVVHEYDEVLAGEAMRGGPVMLSWSDVRRAGRESSQAYNVVIHEFAHVLDLATGAANGVPELPSGWAVAEWHETISLAYEEFVHWVEEGRATALDAYGAVSLEEFFAVASEGFFVSPLAVRQDHPRLYALLMRFYGQDPALELPPKMR